MSRHHLNDGHVSRLGSIEPWLTGATHVWPAVLRRGEESARLGVSLLAEQGNQGVPYMKAASTRIARLILNVHVSLRESDTGPTTLCYTSTRPSLSEILLLLLLLLLLLITS